MIKEYLTVAGQEIVEIEEKRSRFISSAFPASSEDEAKALVQRVKSAHRDASHNVYAYITGHPPTTRKSSDDGEPQGTAGVPVLDVISREGLTDCLIIVTRYFGGTLLGAAGLVRAYSRSAAAVLEKAGIKKMILCIEAFIICDYAVSGRMMQAARESGGVKFHTGYCGQIELGYNIPVDGMGSFKARVSELSAGKVMVREGNTIYIPAGL